MDSQVAVEDSFKGVNARHYSFAFDQYNSSSFAIKLFLEEYLNFVSLVIVTIINSSRLIIIKDCSFKLLNYLFNFNIELFL